VVAPNHTIFVSVLCSYWEIWLESSIGKVRVPSGFAQRLAAETFVDLPPWSGTSEILSIPMLIAQAKSEILILLTVDRGLSAARLHLNFKRAAVVPTRGYYFFGGAPAPLGPPGAASRPLRPYL